MEARYNVYFAGEILDGHDPRTVREKLAKVFKANENTLDKLFSGQAQLLKRDCDKATAMKFKNALETAGAQPIIKTLQATGSAQTTSADEPMTAAQKIAALAAAPTKGVQGQSTTGDPAAEAPQPDTGTDNAGAFDLAPSGADVLREDERAKPLVREVDTSSLEVDTSAVRLAPEAPPAPAAPDTSHLDMGAVGEAIPNLAATSEPLSPNTDGIDLAPADSGFSDCATPAVAELDLDLSALDIAPAGADVLEEQYRKSEQAIAPNTDHLSIDS